MEGRRTLERLWKKNVERGREALSMDAFARDYGLSEARIKRELRRGFTGVLLKDKERGGWIYPSIPPCRPNARPTCRKPTRGGGVL